MWEFVTLGDRSHRCVNKLMKLVGSRKEDLHSMFVPGLTL